MDILEPLVVVVFKDTAKAVLVSVQNAQKTWSGCS